MEETRQLKVSCWNIATINNKLVEHWAMTFSPSFPPWSQFQLLIETPKFDVEIERIFTNEMFKDLKFEMASQNIPGIDEIEWRWRRDFSQRQAVTEFLKDRTMMHLVAMPDRATNTVNVYDGGTENRPTAINAAMNAGGGSLGTVECWWTQWRKFMFHTIVSLASMIDERNPTTPKFACSMINVIPRSKYPGAIEEVEPVTVGLQLLCLAIFDSIFIHMFASQELSWEKLQDEFSNGLIVSKHATICDILAHSHAEEDVIFILNGSIDFADHARRHPSLSSTHFPFSPSYDDGVPNQVSLLLLSRRRFCLVSCHDVTTCVLAHSANAKGHLLAVSVRDDTGRSWLLASFHCNRSRQSTLPVLQALHTATRSDPSLCRHLFLAGLDPADVVGDERGAEGLSMLAFCRQLAELGMSSVWGPTQTPSSGLPSAANSGAHFLTNPDKSNPLRHRTLLAQGDLKNWIVGYSHQLTDFHDVALDGTAHRAAIADDILPSLDLPFDHAIVSASLIFFPEAAVAATLPDTLPDFSNIPSNEFNVLASNPTKQPPTASKNIPSAAVMTPLSTDVASPGRFPSPWPQPADPPPVVDFVPARVGTASAAVISAPMVERLPVGSENEIGGGSDPKSDCSGSGDRWRSVNTGTASKESGGFKEEVETGLHGIKRARLSVGSTSVRTAVEFLGLADKPCENVTNLHPWDASNQFIEESTGTVPNDLDRELADVCERVLVGFATRERPDELTERNQRCALAHGDRSVWMLFSTRPVRAFLSKRWGQLILLVYFTARLADVGLSSSVMMAFATLRATHARVSMEANGTIHGSDWELALLQGNCMLPSAATGWNSSWRVGKGSVPLAGVSFAAPVHFEAVRLWLSPAATSSSSPVVSDWPNALVLEVSNDGKQWMNIVNPPWMYTQALRKPFPDMKIGGGGPDVTLNLWPPSWDWLAKDVAGSASLGIGAAIAATLGAAGRGAAGTKAYAVVGFGLSSVMHAAAAVRRNLHSATGEDSAAALRAWLAATGLLASAVMFWYEQYTIDLALPIWLVVMAVESWDSLLRLSPAAGGERIAIAFICLCHGIPSAIMLILLVSRAKIRTWVIYLISEDRKVFDTVWHTLLATDSAAATSAAAAARYTDVQSGRVLNECQGGLIEAKVWKGGLARLSAIARRLQGPLVADIRQSWHAENFATSQNGLKAASILVGSVMSGSSGTVGVLARADGQAVSNLDQLFEQAAALDVLLRHKVCDLAAISGGCFWARNLQEDRHEIRRFREFLLPGASRYSCPVSYQDPVRKQSIESRNKDYVEEGFQNNKYSGCHEAIGCDFDCVSNVHVGNEVVDSTGQNSCKHDRGEAVKELDGDPHAASINNETGDWRIEMAVLKPASRALEKLLRSYGHDVSCLLDCCRQAIYFEEVDELTDCLEAMTRDPEIRILRLRNGLDPSFSAADTAGFRIVVVNLQIKSTQSQKLGIDSHVCELQLVPRCFAENMTQQSHERYLILRNCRQHRPLAAAAALAMYIVAVVCATPNLVAATTAQVVARAYNVCCSRVARSGLMMANKVHVDVEAASCDEDPSLPVPAPRSEGVANDSANANSLGNRAAAENGSEGCADDILEDISVERNDGLVEEVREAVAGQFRRMVTTRLRLGGSEEGAAALRYAISRATGGSVWDTSRPIAAAMCKDFLPASLILLLVIQTLSLGLNLRQLFSKEVFQCRRLRFTAFSEAGAVANLSVAKRTWQSVGLGGLGLMQDGCSMDLYPARNLSTTAGVNHGATWMEIELGEEIWANGWWLEIPWQNESVPNPVRFHIECSSGISSEGHWHTVGASRVAWTWAGRPLMRWDHGDSSVDGAFLSPVQNGHRLSLDLRAPTAWWVGKLGADIILLLMEAFLLWMRLTGQELRAPSAVAMAEAFYAVTMGLSAVLLAIEGQRRLAEVTGVMSVVGMGFPVFFEWSEKFARHFLGAAGLIYVSLIVSDYWIALGYPLGIFGERLGLENLNLWEGIYCVSLAVSAYFMRFFSHRRATATVAADCATYRACWSRVIAMDSGPKLNQNDLHAFAAAVNSTYSSVDMASSVVARGADTSGGGGNLHRLEALAAKLAAGCENRTARQKSGGDGSYASTKKSELGLDQLFAKAACLDPFLRRKVQQWALASHGCFPINLHRTVCGRSSGGGQNKPSTLVFRRWETLLNNQSMMRQVKWGQLKTMHRAVEKVHRSYRGDVTRLLDCCRQSIYFEELEHLVCCLETIAVDPDVQIFRIQNRMRPSFDDAQTAGYRDVLVNLALVTRATQQLAVHTLIAELQLILVSFAKIKTDEGHKRYVTWRNHRGA